LRLKQVNKVMYRLSTAVSQSHSAKFYGAL
jgi:hypothetical protein